MEVDGIQVGGIPFTFQGGGGATFSVSLRVGLKTGLGINFLGTGFELETGIYVDVPTYSASITFDPAAECQLDFKEGFFGVAAAYAQIAASVDYIGWSAGPSTAVTFFTADLPGGCIASKTNLIGGGGSTTNMLPSTAIPVTSTAEHLNFTTKTAHSTTMLPHSTSVANSTSVSNATVNGVLITSPAIVVILPTPVEGSFVSGTSVSAPTAGTAKQAIAPAGTLSKSTVTKETLATIK